MLLRSPYVPRWIDELLSIDEKKSCIVRKFLICGITYLLLFHYYSFSDSLSSRENYYSIRLLLSSVYSCINVFLYSILSCENRFASNRKLVKKQITLLGHIHTVHSSRYMDWPCFARHCLKVRILAQRKSH